MSPPPDDTSSSLLSRVKNRDADAYVQLVRWIGPRILRWCELSGLQDADREEVSQQVLMNVWHGIAAFRKVSAGDSFRGWVYSITRNCIRDLLTKRRAPPQPLPVESDPSEANDLKRRALQFLVQSAVARHAKDSEFRAFYRTAVDGLSPTEAARELSLSADVVRKHKSRWIKRLRDQSRDQFGELLD